jgi:hypothetical protein
VRDVGCSVNNPHDEAASKAPSNCLRVDVHRYVHPEANAAGSSMSEIPSPGTAALLGWIYYRSRCRSSSSVAVAGCLVMS